MAARPDPGWAARWHQLLRGMARVHTPAGREQLLQWLLATEQPRVLAFADAPAMNLAAQDRAFFHQLAEADVVVREGAAVGLLMRLLNQAPGQDLRAAQFVPRLLAAADGSPIALFGSTAPWLAGAQRRLAREVAPRSRVVAADGASDLTAYLRIAARAQPRLIVLGLDPPRQLEVAIALRNALGRPCLIVCGGAVLDRLGGRPAHAAGRSRPHGLRGLLRFLGRALRVAAGSLRARGTAAA